MPPPGTARRDRSHGRRPRPRPRPPHLAGSAAHSPRVAFAVLDHVCQGFLNDPVGLVSSSPGSKPARRSFRPPARPEMPVDSWKVSASRSSAETSPKSSSTLRPQLDRQAANVLQRGHDQIAHVLARRRASGLPGRRCLLDRPQPEQDRRQRLPGLVVQLAGQPASLQLLRLHDAPQCPPGSSAPRDRPPLAARAAKDLGDPEIVVGERVPIGLPPCRRRRPRRSRGRGRSAAGTDADCTARRRAGYCSSASASPSSESTRSLRLRSNTRPSFDDSTATSLSPPGLCPHRARPPPRPAAPHPAPREGDRDDPRPDQLPQPARDEVEKPRQLDLRGQRVSDLRQRLELARPPRRGLVQARVLNRHRGLRSEQLHDLLVLPR